MSCSLNVKITDLNRGIGSLEKKSNRANPFEC